MPLILPTSRTNTANQHVQKGGVTGALHKSSVHMKNEARVMEIIGKMAQGGKAKLQVVADFGNTLTRYRLNGTKCIGSCHKAIDASPRLSDEYREEAEKIRRHYYPIEIDPNLTDEQKLPSMKEWWTRSHDLLMDCGLNRQKIEQIIEEAPLYFREGCKELYKTLADGAIPLLIFSAGLGNVIEIVLQQQAALHNNITIISNFMEFNDQGEILGFKGDFIHSLNKHQRANSEYFKQSSVRERENVVILGDSLGDLCMADGATNRRNCLTIGFLNDRVSDKLNSYMDAFDIVLINDETMDVPRSILEKIIG